MTFNSNGPGHYNYAVPIPDDAADSHPSQSRGTKCLKKECSISACSSDMLGNCRCPCAKIKKPCTSSCRCKNCCNNFGTRTVQHQRKRYSYSTQKQPLCGRKGTKFLKAVDEHESVGQTAVFEKLLIAAILINFIVNGIEVTPENACKSYSYINRLVNSFSFVEFPLFIRTKDFFARYLLRFKKIMKLFTTFCLSNTKHL